MALWNTTTLRVMVDVQDMRDEIARIDRDGEEKRVMAELDAEVDIDEALEEATVDQLRAALAREDDGYTQDELSAIEAAFAAALSGDASLAAAMLSRIFKHDAQRQAAERGLALFPTRIAA